MSKTGVQQAYNLGRETYLQGKDFHSADFKDMTDIEYEMYEKGFQDAQVVDPDTDDGIEEIDFNT